MNIRAVVLAAGQGKRMKSARPKVLHEVLGRAILARVLDALDALELEHIHIVVGHGAAEVTAFLDANPPSTPWSAHLQEPQLGTGHALRQVPLAGFTGTLLVAVADTPLLTGATLERLIDAHRQEEAVVSLLTTVVEDPKTYGRIVRDDFGEVVQIVEDKDATAAQRQIREINPAIYCFEYPAVCEGLSRLSNQNKQGEYYLTDLVAWAHHKGLRISSAVAEDWREVAGINSRLELAEASALLNARVVANLALQCGVTVMDPHSTWIAPEVKVGRETIVMPGCLLMGDVQIGEACTIGPHTVMHGPVKVGDRTTVMQSLVIDSDVGSDCRVGPFAHLRERACIADYSRIGNYVEIKKSEIGSHTNVSHLSYVGDATVGSKVNIGAGTITANYNHLTGQKSRTIIGDGAFTGSNSVLVAPVEVGPGASVAAGTVVTKNVPDGALAVGRARQENKEGWVERRRSQLRKT
ncbi:MAG TPA: bifunctional UDP-N-acetylglucosamine diphosphorylase/glucosamine-1-phosphate N-acetyltransferase GlmU [Candidatus Obscuribacterales bacterium]